MANNYIQNEESEQRNNETDFVRISSRTLVSLRSTVSEYVIKFMK